MSIPIESFKQNWNNAANLITSVRLFGCWVPAVLLLANPNDTVLRWWAVATFIFVAATDALDGYVARRFNQVSEWGKFIDPLVDKFLIVLTMVGICIAYLDPWLALALTVIVAREIIVTIQIRTRGKLVMASGSGKLKMIAQVIMAIAWLIPLDGVWHPIRILATLLALILTLYSWLRYYQLFVQSSAPPHRI